MGETNRVSGASATSKSKLMVVYPAASGTKVVLRIRLKRPYITLKWAESADGFIDINRTGGKPIILSNPLTSMLVHKKRAEHDAILVGRHTALFDNPSLSTRNWYGKHPVRLVIDKELTLPRDLELFNGKIKTFVFTRESPCQPNALTEYISLDFNKDILPQIMEVLYQKKIQSLLVEGGSILLQSFIDSGLWDEAFIEKAPLRLNNGIQAPSIQKKHFKLNKIYFGREIMHAVHSQIQRITQAVQVVSQIDLFCSLDVHKEIVFSEYFDYFFFCPQLLKLCGLYNHFTKLLIYSPPE